MARFRRCDRRVSTQIGPGRICREVLRCQRIWIFWPYGVLDLVGLAVVGEASGEAPYDSGSLLQFLQHQRSPIGGNVAPIEAPHQLSPSQVLRGLERLSQRVESARSR